MVLHSVQRTCIMETGSVGKLMVMEKAVGILGAPQPLLVCMHTYVHAYMHACRRNTLL